MKKLFLLFFVILCTHPAIGQEIKWDFLDIKTIGAEKFIRNNPTADGRGTIIYILDCGVDPAIPGLTSTTEGKTKIVEIQDFSGQVELTLIEAKPDTVGESIYLTGGGARIEGWKSLALAPIEGRYYIAQLREDIHFKNSEVEDINSNGKKNDAFAILAFPIDGGHELLRDAAGLVKPDAGEEIWVYYADEDADGNIDDEEPRFDYRYRYDIFDFYENEKDRLPLLTLSANINGQSRQMTINVCDGSHGTHCAGIAAGNDIYGAAGNDGIAPGAYVASFKIGDNLLSGGATTLESMKKAYEYGIEFMKQAGFEHAIFSMSYGIGSETPGRSDIEKYLDRFTLEHPEVVIVTSNGNAGPGINSTGNPSASDGLLAVGAMISPATLDNLYGSPRDKNWITHFSSRGGESAKPDVIAPGAAMSTVPRFTHGEAYWGTSMACPEVAGACAILLSAAKRDGLDFDGYMVMKAIKYTARPVPGYSPVDYGNGLVDIEKAYEYLKILAKRDKSKEAAYYVVRTENTFYPDLSGPAAFWKAGGYFPQQGNKQAVMVSPRFGDEVSKSNRTDFYRPFRLETTADWLRTDKSKFYIHGETPAAISLIYNESKLRKPGVYSAKVYAYAEDAPNGGFPEFDIEATVVIPYKFDASNNFSQQFRSQKLSAGDIERIFVAVPPAATAMNVRMKAINSDYYHAGLYAFAPDGNRLYHNEITQESDDEIFLRYDEDHLRPGIWEIIPYCAFTAENAARYDMDISFYSIATEPAAIESLEMPAGENPSGSFKLINQYNRPVTAAISGSIDGYAKSESESIQGNPKYTRSFTAADDESMIIFEIEMSDEDYNKFTDIPVTIYNSAGDAVLQTGMSRKYTTVAFRPPSAGDYRLEIVSAFTHMSTLARELTYSITEKHYFSNKIKIKPRTSRLDLYPAVERELSFEVDGRIPMAPDGCYIFGEINLKNIENDETVKTQKIFIQ
ncbi:MAG: S8 family serine peptidase [Candidatus Kapaibacterium sp.]